MKSRDGKEIRTVLYYVFVDVLLICLLVVWSRCPTLRGIRFHGDKAEREELKATVLNPSTRAEDRDWDVCVTTYEIFNLEVNAFRHQYSSAEY
jgi:hypothetical protein